MEREVPKIPKVQQEGQPAMQHRQDPQPVSIDTHYLPGGKLQGKVALITGGDSGIGRAVALHFMLEGADVAIAYHPSEEKDARDTEKLLKTSPSCLLSKECWSKTGGVTRVEDMSCSTSGKCPPKQEGYHRKGEPNILLVPVDLVKEEECTKLVQTVKNHFGNIDILVLNAAVQHVTQKPEEVTAEKLNEVFGVNVFSPMFIVREALKSGCLSKNGNIIVSTSVVSYKGQPHLYEYAVSKGAVTAFIRSLSLMLVERGIRVNGVAPGPIWTPLIEGGYPLEKMESFGENTPAGRFGMPSEVAPAYVYLASTDSSYVCGQVIHVNGGYIVNA
jgi:NAD(P)-dependent dehydrogenase (short-subunit alcohol dehydrogenase family)